MRVIPNSNPVRKNARAAIAALTAFLFLGPQRPDAAEPAAGAASAGSRPQETVQPPKSTPDPLEPVNRVVWSVNKGLMSGVIAPSSKVYRFVVVKPVRTGIANLARNLTYPDRLVNNLLQGRWKGAGDETERFFCNSVLGLGGLFDVASRWKIGKSDADFGQTFGKWGWKPGVFLMLPLLGPSNERDLLGYAGDTAINPLDYVTPDGFNLSESRTYLNPYSFFDYTATYNGLSDSVGNYVRYARSEADSYAGVQYAWGFARATRTPDLQVHGEQDKASLETVASVFFTFKDPKFPGRCHTRSVVIPATGKRLPFEYWLQPRPAPVVYVVPGLGSHRLTQPAIALAELIYNSGCTVAVISSAFHPEFMENASTADVPGYVPVDGRDVHVALSEIDRRLRALHPGRLGERAVIGYSMGALHSLFMGAQAAPAASGLIAWDRCVGVNPPVRLLHGVDELDSYYQAPLAWPAAERNADLENLFLKAAALRSEDPAALAGSALPLNAIESKFLIGLAFRLTLRDVLYSSQRRHNQGVLQQPLRNLRRAAVYDEIMRFSYRDYFEKFVVPYFDKRNIGPSTAAALDSGGDLHSYEASLRSNPKIRVLGNRNDFLLSRDDVTWLETTIPAGQIALFDSGGHVGNLGEPAMQKAILAALSGLKPERALAE